MNLTRQTKNKKGVAIFFVLFVMVILGILVVQFSVRSRQAQSTVHRFQTSEMARQLASAAQEEAFKYLYDNTDNYDSKGFDELNSNPILKKIIEGKESNIYVPNFNRTETNGLKLNIPATEAMAKDLMGDRMEVSATARIIDFRDTDPDNHTFYGKEGIGTIEIVTIAKAKEKYKNQFPGACTIVRHHDYKVVSLLSKKDERDKYVGNSFLDYALFIRKGQEEFENGAKGTNVNPENLSLEINAGDFPGKINFGSGGLNYQYLNISSDTIDFLGPKREKTEIVELKASDSEVDKIYPYFRNELAKQADDEGGKLESLTGHKAYFEFYRLPLLEKFYENDETLKNIMVSAAANAQKKLNKNISFNTDHQPYFFEGIKITPINKLNEILTSDIRKQFINIGYFKLDLTDCEVTIGADDDSETLVIKRDKPELIEQYKKEPFYCFDIDYHIPYIDDPNNEDYVKKINMIELNKFIKSKGKDIASNAFTYINDEYKYQLEDELPSISDNENDFYNRDYMGGYKPSEAQYPFAHFNLFNKRYVNNDKPEELEELGIYDKKENVLNLRGIIQCSNLVELGNENTTLKIKGSGVLIARGITIKGAIEKDNKKSIAVLFARNGDIRIKTNKKIEAALIAMKGPDGDGVNQGVEGRIIAEETMNLFGSLAVDKLNTTGWKKDTTHKITYDEALAPTKDVYQVNIANWVTYERVIENE